MSNIRQLKLNNKKFAEELVAFFNENKNVAKLEEQDGKFLVNYEIVADDQSKECIDEKLSAFAQYIFRVIDDQRDYTYRQFDAVWSWIGNHSPGHLPPLTPSGLSKLIRAAGQEDDYQVAPRTIYASSNGIEFGTTELKAALTKINEKDDANSDPEVSRLLNAIRTSQKK